MRRGILALPRALALPAALVLLTGCATPYAPVVIDVQNPAQYRADTRECMKIARNSAPRSGLRLLFSKTVKGAAGSADLAALDPLSLAIGAGEGLVTGAFIFLGLISDNRRSIFLACLTRRAGQHGYGVLGTR